MFEPNKAFGFHTAASQHGSLIRLDDHHPVKTSYFHSATANRTRCRLPAVRPPPPGAPPACWLLPPAPAPAACFPPPVTPLPCRVPLAAAAESFLAPGVCLLGAAAANAAAVEAVTLTVPSHTAWNAALCETHNTWAGPWRASCSSSSAMRRCSGQVGGRRGGWRVGRPVTVHPVVVVCSRSALVACWMGHASKERVTADYTKTQLHEPHVIAPADVGRVGMTSQLMSRHVCEHTKCMCAQENICAQLLARPLHSTAATQHWCSQSGHCRGRTTF